MVSSVRFGTTMPQSASFQDLINRPQAYQQTAPAATNISGGKKKSKAGKIILGTVATAAAVTGGMVAVSKFAPQLNNLVGKIKNDQIKTILENGINKIGNWGDSIAKFSKSAYDAGKKEIQKLPQKFQEGIDWCKNTFQAMKSNLQKTTADATQ